jgi:hypothetical protein
LKARRARHVLFSVDPQDLSAREPSALSAENTMIIIAIQQDVPLVVDHFSFIDHAKEPLALHLMLLGYLIVMAADRLPSISSPIGERTMCMALAREDNWCQFILPGK